jgi:nucleoside-diphosphate-sugar epimerase
VWGVRRQAVELAGVRMLRADVTDPATLGVLRGVQPQYVLLVLTPGGFSDERYRQVYVDGLANCLAALDASRLRHVFWVSSTSVFHQDGGELLDEHSAAQPGGFSGRRLLEAEALLGRLAVPHTCVRFGGIYGPGRDRLLRQLRGGARSPTAPVRYSNRIHRDDAVGILRFLLARAAAGEPLAPLYLGVDAEPAPIAEVERWFSGALGLDYAALVEQDGELRGGNRRCSSALLQASGYRFLYPTYREGLPTLLADTAE